MRQQKQIKYKRWVICMEATQTGSMVWADRVGKNQPSVRAIFLVPGGFKDGIAKIKREIEHYEAVEAKEKMDLKRNRAEVACVTGTKTVRGKKRRQYPDTDWAQDQPGDIDSGSVPNGDGAPRGELMEIGGWDFPSFKAFGKWIRKLLPW